MRKEKLSIIWIKYQLKCLENIFNEIKKENLPKLMKMTIKVQEASKYHTEWEKNPCDT